MPDEKQPKSLNSTRIQLVEKLVGDMEREEPNLNQEPWFSFSRKTFFSYAQGRDDECR